MATYLNTTKNLLNNDVLALAGGNPSNNVLAQDVIDIINTKTEINQLDYKVISTSDVRQPGTKIEDPVLLESALLSYSASGYRVVASPQTNLFWAIVMENLGI